MNMKEYVTKGGVLRAHHAEVATEVTVVGNWARRVEPGDWIIATNRPETFEVMSDSDFQSYLKTDDGDSDEVESFDPSEHTASEVREYLTSVRYTNPDEYGRVVTAEVSGRNRVSAFPA